MAHEITPESYLSDPQLSEAEGFGTPEEVEAASFERMGRGLDQRALNKQLQQGVGDDDLDMGTYDPNAAKVESLLAEAIANASRANNPADRARFQADAEKYAAALVGNQAKDPSPDLYREERETARERLENQGIFVDEVLSYAGENLDDESITGWNTLIQGKDRQVAYEAVQLLDHWKSSPEQYISRDQMSPLPDALCTEIAAEFSEPVAKMIQLASLAVAEGVKQPHEIYRDWMKNDSVKKAVLTLMKRGTIVMPI